MAGDKVSINGRSYDWESVSINGPQGVVTGISEINWNSEKPKKEVYGKSPVAKGRTRSNYSAKFDMTLDLDEYADLVSSLENGIYDSEFDYAIVIEGNRKHETVLKKMTVNTVGNGAKNDDNEITKKLTGILRMVENDGKPEYEEK